MLDCKLDALIRSFAWEKKRFSWQHKTARITWPLTLTLSTPWMQADLESIVCKFDGDPAICLRELMLGANSHEFSTLCTLSTNWLQYLVPPLSRAGKVNIKDKSISKLCRCKMQHIQTYTSPSMHTNNPNTNDLTRSGILTQGSADIHSCIVQTVGITTCATRTDVHHQPQSVPNNLLLQHYLKTALHHQHKVAVHQ